jgi:hypothetical protein
MRFTLRNWIKPLLTIKGKQLSCLEMNPLLTKDFSSKYLNDSLWCVFFNNASLTAYVMERQIVRLYLEAYGVSDHDKFLSANVEGIDKVQMS